MWHLFHRVQASSKLTIPPIILTQSYYFGTGTSNDHIIPFHRGVDRATNLQDAKKMLYVFRTILSDRINILNSCLWSGSNLANNLFVVMVGATFPITPLLFQNRKYHKSMNLRSFQNLISPYPFSTLRYEHAPIEKWIRLSMMHFVWGNMKRLHFFGTEY
jgi:hypothetical protein